MKVRYCVTSIHIFTCFCYCSDHNNTVGMLDISPHFGYVTVNNTLVPGEGYEEHCSVEQRQKALYSICDDDCSVLVIIDLLNTEL